MSQSASASLLIDYQPFSLDLVLPPLSANAVQVWYWALDVSAEQQTQYWALLDAETQARALRFRTEQLQQRFIAAHGGLHALLSTHAACEAQTLRFAYSDKGKPSLLGADTDLQFNLSHSEGWAACALARGRAVGVDIEARERSISNPLSLAKRFFSAEECADLQALPAEQLQSAFLRAWVAKEAVLKATGEGLSGLDHCRIAVSFDQQAAILALGTGEEKNWQLQYLPEQADFIGCLCVQRR